MLLSSNRLGTRYRDNYWRPITAIRYPGTYLSSGRSISSPNWTPLLSPTPSHPDYTSTHATFGGAAAQVIANFNGGDKIDVIISSNVTVENVGVITRRYTNLTYANWENGESRVLGGVSSNFNYCFGAVSCLMLILHRYISRLRLMRVIGWGGRLR